MTVDPTADASAQFRGIRATGAVEHIDVAMSGHRLAEGGFWVVVGTFEGRIDAWRFDCVERTAPVREPEDPAREWLGPDPHGWTSSLSRDAYMDGVARIRRDIRDGEVYQVNLCRVLSAELPAPVAGPDAVALS